ncbi:MAG TPA: NAD(P)-binding domain-containing protein [Trebonia sp.]|jgi:thioredoxin reductase
MGAGSLDYLIIGAGPAGLQLAQELGAAGHDYLVLESGTVPGSFFGRFPRHRQLISINKPHTGTDDPEFNLRMDWNSLLATDDGPLFTGYSERYFPQADELLRYLADYARRYDLRIDYETTVTRVGRPGDGSSGDGGGFEVSDSRGRTHRARRVVVATGVSRPYIPPIPGIELAEQYETVTVDPKDFTNQRVLIIGKGNSALETADNLVATAAVIHVAGPDSVHLAWRTHYVGHLRAVNNNFLDTYQLKSQNAILDGTLLSIERDPDPEDGGNGMFTVRFSFSRANEVIKELRYDRVIACTGFRFDVGIFDDTCRPALVHHDRFPRLTSAYEAESIPGLYVAGTVTQVRDFKHGTSGFIHGFRYGVRALRKILQLRYHQVPWPSVPVPGTAEAIAGAVLNRVNRTSALYQQFGVLGDVVLRPHGVSAASGPGGASGGGEQARYLEEVPVDFVRDGGLDDLAGPATDVLVVTLEYGPDHDQVDPFDVTVARVAQDDAERALDAAYLHPVVRLYRDGAPIATHHVAENLENEWDKPAHRDPLIAFLAEHDPSGLAVAAG